MYFLRANSHCKTTKEQHLNIPNLQLCYSRSSALSFHALIPIIFTTVTAPPRCISSEWTHINFCITWSWKHSRACSILERGLSSALITAVLVIISPLHDWADFPRQFLETSVFVGFIFLPENSVLQSFHWAIKNKTFQEKNMFSWSKHAINKTYVFVLWWAVQNATQP